MVPKKIGFLGLKNLFKNLRKNSSDCIGNFLYKGFRIQISKYNLSGNERVMQLYKRRRKEGLCIQCGKKVENKNPRTGEFYRLCDYHRKKIDHTKKR